MTAAAKVITSRDVRDLLEIKHRDDKIVHEAPTGPHAGRGYGQIDTWVLRTSWTQATTIGYEIKVTRRDFLADQKWMKYLPLCNEFYFVVAPGVCGLEEVPEAAGLMVCSKNAARLFTKKKAPYREAEDLDLIFRAVLMNRAHILPGRNSGQVMSRQEWIERLRRDVEGGRGLCQMVRGPMLDELRVAEREAREAKDAVKRYEEFRERLTDAGFDPDAGVWKFRDELRRKLGTHVKPIVERAVTDLTRTLKAIENAEEAT